jgi:competence protein ComEC
MARYKWLVPPVIVYLLLFFWRYCLLRPQKLSLGTQVEIIFVLDNEPEVSGNSQCFKTAGFRILTRRYPEYHYGEKLKIVGKIEEYQTIPFPNIIRLNERETSVFLEEIFDLRKRIEIVLKTYLPEPQASLLIGILLGIKNFSNNFSDDLKRSGLIHIVVVSGSNVTIVASFFLYLSGLIKRKTALIFCLLAIIVYTLMVGAQPPIIRAALMGGLSYLAQVFGRQSYQVLTLILVAAIMLLYNPFYLFDISFQLSFLATGGIILFAPLFLKFLKSGKKGLAVAFATTVSAQLFVTPLIISKFGQFPLFCLITNILVYPIIEPLMILGFPYALLGMIAPTVAQVVSFFLWLPLTYFVWVIFFFGNLNFSLIKLPKLPFVFFGPYYLFLLYLWYRWQRWRFTKDSTIVEKFVKKERGTNG